LEYYLNEPRKHLQIYIDKYSFLIDGTATKQINEFIAASKSFQEYVLVIYNLNIKLFLKIEIHLLMIVFFYNLSIKSFRVLCSDSKLTKNDPSAQN